MVRRSGLETGNVVPVAHGVALLRRFLHSDRFSGALLYNWDCARARVALLRNEMPAAALPGRKLKLAPWRSELFSRDNE